MSDFMDQTHRTDICRLGQVAYYRRVGRIGGRIVRVTIRSDSTRPQASALGELWDGDKWQVVASIAYPLMKTTADGYSRALEARDFAADEGTLVAELSFLTIPY
jgi:hypothetical protein